MEAPSAESDGAVARRATRKRRGTVPPLRRTALRLARSRLSSRLARHVDPEDVVQSAYRSFFTGARAGRYALRRSGDLWRLLAAITLHKVRRQVERHTAGKRDVGREQPAAAKSEPASPDEMLAREPTPEEAAALVDTLEQAFRGLEPLQRRMVELRLQGCGLDEIAADVGRSERTCAASWNGSRNGCKPKRRKDEGARGRPTRSAFLPLPSGRGSRHVGIARRRVARGCQSSWNGCWTVSNRPGRAAPAPIKDFLPAGRGPAAGRSTNSSKSIWSIAGTPAPPPSPARGRGWPPRRSRGECGSTARPRLEDYARRLPRLGPSRRLPLDLICRGVPGAAARGATGRATPSSPSRFPRHGEALAAALARIDADLRDEMPTVCLGRPPRTGGGRRPRACAARTAGTSWTWPPTCRRRRAWPAPPAAAFAVED